MMVPIVMVMIVALTAVSATFWLKGHPHLHQRCSKALQHMLNHVVGPYAKNRLLDLGRQMPIPQMPGKAHQLTWIVVPDFNGELQRSLDLQPSPIVQLQTIAVRHRNRRWQIEKDFFALVRSHANPPTMAGVEVESQSPCRRCVRPTACRTMNGSSVQGHVST
jgi:hypothetical protein